MCGRPGQESGQRLRTALMLAIKMWMTMIWGLYDTLRYDTVYLMCSQKLTGSQVNNIQVTRTYKALLLNYYYY